MWGDLYFTLIFSVNTDLLVKFYGGCNDISPALLNRIAARSHRKKIFCYMGDLFATFFFLWRMGGLSIWGPFAIFFSLCGFFFGLAPPPHRIFFRVPMIQPSPCPELYATAPMSPSHTTNIRPPDSRQICTCRTEALLHSDRSSAGERTP